MRWGHGTPTSQIIFTGVTEKCLNVGMYVEALSLTFLTSTMYGQSHWLPHQHSEGRLAWTQKCPCRNSWWASSMMSSWSFECLKHSTTWLLISPHSLVLIFSLPSYWSLSLLFWLQKSFVFDVCTIYNTFPNNSAHLSSPMIGKVNRLWVYTFEVCKFEYLLSQSLVGGPW